MKVKMVKKLKTPFGYIDIKIDDISVPYIAQKGSPDEGLWPNVLGRYQIDVPFIPDGKNHEISCTFSPCCSYNKDCESGERLECLGFYNSQGYKMSIGIKSNKNFLPDDTLCDYGGGYLENGMVYHIWKKTKTQHFVFGIAWIDNVDWDGLLDDEEYRDTETWYGADPSFSL